MYQALGVHFEWQSRFLEARDHYAKALEVIGSVYGSSSRRYGDYLSGVAMMEQRLGNTARASDLLAEAIRILEETQGPRSHMLAQPLNMLAGLRRETGNLLTSRQLYQRTIDLLHDGDEPTGHPHRLIDAFVGLSATARLAGDLDAARTAIRRASDHAAKNLPADSVKVAGIEAEIAIQAWLRGDRELAGRRWSRLDSIAADHLETGDIAVRTALTTYFQFLRDSRRVEQLQRIVKERPAYAAMIRSLQ